MSKFEVGEKALTNDDEIVIIQAVFQEKYIVSKVVCGSEGRFADDYDLIKIKPVPRELDDEDKALIQKTYGGFTFRVKDDRAVKGLYKIVGVGYCIQEKVFENCYAIEDTLSDWKGMMGFDQMDRATFEKESIVLKLPIKVINAMYLKGEDGYEYVCFAPKTIEIDTDMPIPPLVGSNENIKKIAKAISGKNIEMTIKILD